MRPSLQEQGLTPTKANLMAAYTGRVRSNIHMVLCMRYRSQHSTQAQQGWAGVHWASRKEKGLGLATMPSGPGYCVLPPGCHATGKGPGSWVSGAVSQCLRASFGLLALQPHRRGFPSSPEAVPVPSQLLYHRLV